MDQSGITSNALNSIDIDNVKKIVSDMAKKIASLEEALKEKNKEIYTLNTRIDNLVIYNSLEEF